MHELTVTQSILDIALRHAREADAERVTGLHLVIGHMASIVDDSVQFYWDIISKGTPAEGAKLYFTRIPTELVCLECGRSYAPGKDDLACPNCSSVKVKVARGEEFYLEAIDIEGAPVTVRRVE